MHGPTEPDSVRPSQWVRRGYAADMVSHVAGPGGLISENIIRNARDTSLRGQTKGSISVCPDFPIVIPSSSESGSADRETASRSPLLGYVELMALPYTPYIVRVHYI